MQTIYNVAEAWESDAARYRIEETVEGELVATRQEGSRRTDLIGTTRLRYAVSERARTALLNADLSGMSFRAVTVEAGDEPMWLLDVQGTAGTVDLTSGVDCDAGEAYAAMAGRRAVRGLTVDPSTLDGSDFFSPRGQNWLLCSARARDAIIAAGLSNLKLEPFDEVVIPLLGGAGG